MISVLIFLEMLVNLGKILFGQKLGKFLGELNITVLIKDFHSGKTFANFQTVYLVASFKLWAEVCLTCSERRIENFFERQRIIVINDHEKYEQKASLKKYMHLKVFE